MNKPLIMIGAGGHASVLADILTRQGQTILALVAPDSSGKGALAGLPLWQDETLGMTVSPEECLLVNGIGSLPGCGLRAKIFSRYREQGYRFASVLAQEAVISAHASLGQGVQVMPGAIVQSGAQIGDNSIINTGAIVEHDSVLGRHAHLAPRAVLCGGVTLGERVHVGSGAVVVQGLQLGNEAVVGAGAILTRNLPENHIVYPARPYLTERNHKQG